MGGVRSSAPNEDAQRDRARDKDRLGQGDREPRWSGGREKRERDPGDEGEDEERQRDLDEPGLEVAFVEAAQATVRLHDAFRHLPDV